MRWGVRGGVPHAGWLIGNAIALAAFALLASHWLANGQLARTTSARGLAAYLNAASTLPILLLSEVGRLLILAFAGLVHLAMLTRALWRRDGLALLLTAATLGCWLAISGLSGVRLPG